MRKSVELRDDEILTRDDLKEPLDYAYLKLELLNEGLRIEEAAKEGLGETYVLTWVRCWPATSSMSWEVTAGSSSRGSPWSCRPRWLSPGPGSPWTR